MTPVTRLEVADSARSGSAARSAFRRPPLALLPVEYSTPAVEDRALEVQRLLADKGQHRAPSIPALLIAGVTDQPIERLNF